MSKRKKNYPDPLEIVGKYGADALRWVLKSKLMCLEGDGRTGVARHSYTDRDSVVKWTADNLLFGETKEGTKKTRAVDT